MQNFLFFFNVLVGRLCEIAKSKGEFINSKVNSVIFSVLALIVCFSLGITGAISYGNGLLDVAAIAHCYNLYLLAMIICLSLGIAGAISYDNGLLGVAAIAHCSCCCRDLWMGHITGLILDAFCIYLHASLKSGSLRPTTHEREE
jgi:hypothetical protein